MSSSIHGDPDHDHHFDALVSSLIPMVDNVLNETWAFVMGNNTAGRDAEFSAKAAEFSPQLTEISLRLSDIKAKMDTERNLESHIRLVCKDITDHRDSLMTLLQSRECADALEDACLAGDLDYAIQVDLQAKAVRRCCRLSAFDELMYRVHLVDSLGRMKTYIRQYTQAILELILLNDKLHNGKLVSLKRQQQDLNMLLHGAADTLRRA
ncbi:hypothetical protein INS49_001894 [Diaporthe citri]|uniref:uncharacterized protein n=1 Tax=Diaporthe citri TaxID=83186 RepID=UPI001C80560F|nr:uncharacterized protein INS49_001894 [Diaporthe citri]KAG6367699.1 hypothetical protein INS49_001894 [Diaporthe citri]